MHLLTNITPIQLIKKQSNSRHIMLLHKPSDGSHIPQRRGEVLTGLRTPESSSPNFTPLPSRHTGQEHHACRPLFISPICLECPSAQLFPSFPQAFAQVSFFSLLPSIAILFEIITFLDTPVSPYLISYYIVSFTSCHTI